MRLNKLLADRGVCARRKADVLIAEGKVTVNGTVATLGTVVSESDRVAVSGRPLPKSPKHILIAFHKPVGVITTMDKNHKNTVAHHVKTPERLFPIGRLDVATSGLLLLTNDGELAQRLMHPSYEHEKEYDVVIDRPLTDEMKAKLESGVSVLGSKTSPARVHKLGIKRFTLTIHEGRNRQVRRMCEAVGSQVAELKRVRVGPLSLGNLKPGAWKRLSEKEYEELRASV